MRFLGLIKKANTDNRFQKKLITIPNEKQIVNQKVDRNAKIPWTSELSVSSWLIAKKFDIRPIGLAMGNATFTQFTYKGCIDRFAINRASKEKMKALKKAYRVCIERLQAHARSMGANVVIDFRILKHSPFFEHEHNEFVVVGTAVKVQGFSPNRAPVICACTMVELMKLLESGAFPVGIGIGVGTGFQEGYPVDKSWSTKVNIPETRSTTEALEDARTDVKYEVRAFNGTGFLQSRAYVTGLEHEFEINDISYVSYHMKSLIIGTIIIEGKEKHQHTLTTAVDLNH